MVELARTQRRSGSLAAGFPLPLPHAVNPEQDVLGADVVVPEPPRLVLSEDDDVASTFSEPLGHLNGGYRRRDACLRQRPYA